MKKRWLSMTVLLALVLLPVFSLAAEVVVIDARTHGSSEEAENEFNLVLQNFKGSTLRKRIKLLLNSNLGFDPGTIIVPSRARFISVVVDVYLYSGRTLGRHTRFRINDLTISAETIFRVRQEVNFR